MPLPDPIAFDRATGRLDGATIVERGAAMAMQVGAQASALFAHRGYSLGCRLLSTLLGERDIVVRLNEDALFAFPFGDGYWSLLLDRGYVYEAEIARFLLSVADVDYTFIDCGANFGLWSVLVTSRPYGLHRAVAIEASSANTQKLIRNATLNGGRFGVRHQAIGAARGGHAFLRGRKHEALSIAAGDGGAGGAPGEEVDVVSLDSLIDDGVIAADRRHVVKLDIEGVEIDALEGGQRLLDADTVVICEEHGSDRHHKVTRYVLEQTSAHVFVFDPASARFEPVVDLAILDRIKVKRNAGYNVFITKSASWEAHLRAA